MHHTQFSSDDLILRTLQEIVDNWLRNPDRGPFAAEIAHPDRCPWPCLSINPEQHAAFPKLANAVRCGTGHAITNPEPLLRILHGEDEPLVGSRQAIREAIHDLSG